VGKTDPQYKLDVVGTSAFSSNLEVGTANLFVDTVTGNVGVGKTDPGAALDVNGTANLNSNVYVPNIPIATIASNLVTWNSSTGDLMDSGGLISNKLAIVSEQPPAALTGDSTVVDGHGRYKVTTSTTTSTPAYSVFSKTDSGLTSYVGLANSYDANGDLVSNNSLGSVNGEWIKLELPYKTTLRHFSLRQDTDTAYETQLKQFPKDFKIIGSNDDVSWTTLFSVTGVAYPTNASDPAKIFVVNASSTYKYYAIVIEKINSDAANSRPSIGEWRLFTETFTVDAGVVSTTAASGLDVGYTEHPVEPMTDYHTYVEGHGTYEASASSEQAGNAWKMFDYVSTGGIGDSGGAWSDLYNADGTYQGSKYTADVGGTRYTGEWLQLKTPYAILLSHFKWFPTQNWEYRSPAQGLVLGSNDGENWYKLTSWSGETFTFNAGSQIDVNATTPYQYFRLVIENTGTSSDFAAWRASAMEWRLFAEKPVTRMENVHISGDLSSETLQTGYIKWPKVPLKANESEGYVASASSDNGSVGLPYHAFEDKSEYSTSSSPAWVSTLETFSAGVPINGTAASFDGNDCEWLQIQMPRSIQLSHFLIYIREDNSNRLVEGPKSGFMYGSNDGVVWTKLVSYDNLVHVVREGTRVDVQSTEAYKYFRLVVTSTVGTPSHNAVVINELQLFEAATGVGAAPTSAKLQVAGSLGMAKGAEFFAGDDVVMELPKHDRPLVKYPEVASTTVSSSSDTQPGDAFNLNYSDIGWHPVSNYTSGTGVADGTTTTTDLNGTEYDGEWTQVLLPVAVKVKYLDVYYRYDIKRQTRDGTVLGSNDGTNWTHLQSWDDLSLTGSASIPHHLQVNSTKYFKYIRYIVERVAGELLPNIIEIEIWGYEEGDTSVDVVHRSIPNKPGQQQLEVYWDANDSNSYSFADSSNVYDLSGNGVKGTLTGGVGLDTEYNAFTFDGTSDIRSTVSTFSGDQPHTMSVWVYISSALTTTDAYICVLAPSTGEALDQVSTIRFQNNGFNMQSWGNDIQMYDLGVQRDRWYHLTAVYDGGGVTTSSKRLYIDGVQNLSISTDDTSGNTINFTNTTLSLGSRVDGTGSHLKGSISNFRLYSKALNAEQVRELYEYDAPRFGHRQNLVALHKGNLGVGVAHPTSRFEVAGADGLQEYPPKAMTGYETYMEGHGVFRAGGSSDNYNSIGNSSTSGSYAEWRVFDHDRTTDSAAWLAYAGTYSSSLPTASAAKINDISGEYVYIETPHKIKLHSFNISVRNQNANESGRMPVNGIIWGKNDAGEWEQVFSWAGQVYSASDGTQITTFNVNSESPYKIHALQVTKIGSTGSNATAIGEWRLFGTPAPSSLEDGHLTLGKALTLPRISGHAAGAETPRAESLVVHYDTTVDSVVSGSTVVDISGSGNNGTLHGNTSYSSSMRSFDFDGLGADYVSGKLNNTGDFPFTVSIWFYESSNNTVTLWMIGSGSSSANPNPSVALAIDGSDGSLDFFIFSGRVCSLSTFRATYGTHRWHNVVCTRVGNTLKYFINGVEQNITLTGTTDTLSIATDSVFNIGARTGNQLGEKPFSGSISNFKLWDVALTAEEVAMEYALGRTGKSINLTDTALCLGGTVPRAQLDVRGSILIDGRLQIPGRVAFAGRKTNGDSNDSNSPVIFNDMDINVDNCYDTSTGYFTAPVSGLYVYCVQFVSGSTNSNDFKIIKVSGSTSTTIAHSYRASSGSSNEPQGVNDVIVVMNAGDYIKVELVGNATIRGNAHNFIYGYLLE
jgi:hypothetical protein